MAGILPTEGEDRLLSRALGTTVPVDGDITLKLFVNDYTPVDASVNGDFTEMSTNAYAAKVLAQESWTVAQATGVAEGTYAQQAWTFDDTGGFPTTIYGYWLVDEDDVVVGAERFATSYVVTEIGDVLRITPTLTLSKA